LVNSSVLFRHTQIDRRFLYEFWDAWVVIVSIYLYNIPASPTKRTAHCDVLLAAARFAVSRLDWKIWIFSGPERRGATNPIHLFAVMNALRGMQRAGAMESSPDSHAILN